MLDRESTFKDKSIVKMLQNEFVPVAFDQWYLRQQKDNAGDFYRKIAKQGPRNNFNSTTQGFYIVEANGELLGFNNNRGPKRIRGMMNEAVRTHQPTKESVIKAGQPDKRFDRTLPKGAALIRVNSKVLNGYDTTGNPWQQIMRTAVSRDNLWILADEQKKLSNGKLATSLAHRIARFHLVDNTRGEPTMWRKNDIQKLDLSLEDGKLKGQIHLESGDKSRGFQASLYGQVEFQDGKLRRFDVVAKGDYWGEGRWTRGAPRGKFPFAVAFRLADGKDPADSVPPQGTKGWLRGYLDPSQ